MIEISLGSFLWVHLLQLTIGIALIGVVVRCAGRRLPQLTFLLCMLALAKCLFPPVITSPAGLFTRYESIAFSPEFVEADERDVVRWKQNAGIAASELKNSLGPLPIPAWVEVPVAAVWNFFIRKPAWISVCLIVWCLGVAVILWRTLKQAFSLQRMLRRTQVAEQRLHWLCCEIKHQLGMRRAVRVVLSDENYGPACVGFFRTTLILPRELVSRFPDRLLRPIIAHELIHARRGDIFWGYLQFMAQVVWWFHPLVWWLGRRADDLCERCCDAEVLSSKQCKASDYAESLVSVLAMKTSLRAVPLAHSMSPKQITRLRLEAIMRRYGRSSQRTTSLSNWLLVGGLGVLMLPGMHYARGQGGNLTPAGQEVLLGEEEAKATVNRAIQVGDWDTAIRVLSPVVEHQPQNATATFYLAYAFHAKGQYETAVEFHQRAADFETTRPLALYNWACALALQGKSEQALEKLEAALDAGFVARTDLNNDPDFKSILGNSRFQSLRARQLQYRQFDFLVGDWALHGEAGQVRSEHCFNLGEKGHLLQERWQSPTGESGTGILFLHPEDHRWHQTRILSDGTVAEYVAKVDESGVEFNGQVCRTSGEKVLQKIRLVPQSPTEIEQRTERSIDAGETWQVIDRGKLVMTGDRRILQTKTSEGRLLSLSVAGDKLE